MDILIDDAELEAARSELVNSLDELYEIGRQAIVQLERLGSMGYISESMQNAIASRRNVIATAIKALKDAGDPASGGVKELISSIDEMNHL